MRDDNAGSNSGCGMPVSDEPRAMRVACPVQPSKWSVSAVVQVRSISFYPDSIINSQKEEEIMKVQDVMTNEVRACLPQTSLAIAATMMWEHDCGVLPVVGVPGRNVMVANVCLVFAMGASPRRGGAPVCIGGSGAVWCRPWGSGLLAPLLV